MQSYEAPTLRELDDLLEVGAITQEHFTKQRDSLLEQIAN